MNETLSSFSDSFGDFGVGIKAERFPALDCQLVAIFRKFQEWAGEEEQLQAMSMCSKVVAKCSVTHLVTKPKVKPTPLGSGSSGSWIVPSDEMYM